MLDCLWIGLFVSPRRSKSPRPRLCPRVPSPWEWGLWLPVVGCLRWLQIKAWTMVGIGWGEVGGDVSWRGTVEVMLEVQCLGKQEATLHWYSFRKGICFSWPPLTCHQLDVHSWYWQDLWVSRPVTWPCSLQYSYTCEALKNSNKLNNNINHRNCYSCCVHKSITPESRYQIIYTIYCD